MTYPPAPTRLEADLEQSLAAVFRRYPPLCGFSLSSELRVEELACHPALDRRRAAVIAEDIVRALSELLAEEPEAAELIRGRTFARALH